MERHRVHGPEPGLHSRGQVLRSARHDQRPARSRPAIRRHRGTRGFSLVSSGFLLPFDARFHPQDPGISSTQPEGSYWPYEDGVKRDVFIKDSDGNVIIGKVWPGLTAFPDFSNEETHEWWYDNLKRFHEKVPFDGLWIVSMGSGLDEKAG